MNHASLVMPNFWIRVEEAAVLVLVPQVVRVVVVAFVYSAWNMARRSALLSVMLPASWRSRMSVIMASFIVEAAG